MERITNTDGADQRAPHGSQVLVVGLCCLLALGTTGCSLGIMAGKMLMGDPRQVSPFHAKTGTDLTRGKHSVLITCTAPHGILAKYPSLQIDMVDRVTPNSGNAQY